MKKIFLIIFLVIFSILSGCIYIGDNNEPDKDNEPKETYEDGKLFYDGLAVVNNKYINKNYEVVIDDNYYSCESFYKNKAIVLKDYNEYYIIDNTGKYLIGPYNYIKVFKQLDLYVCSLNGSWTVLNLECKEICDTEFETVSFTEVNESKIDLEGLLYVRYDGLYGAIDKLGNWVIEPKYTDEFIFSDGLADVETVDGRALVIDKKDNIIMELKKEHNTDYIFSLSSNVFIKSINYERTYVNRMGNKILLDNYSNPKYYNDNFIHVWYNNTNASNIFIDYEGNQVVDKIFDSVSEIDQFLICRLDVEHYIYDFNGNLLINRPFHSISVNKDFKYIECTNYKNFIDYEVIENLFFDYDGNIIYENTDLNPFMNKQLFRCRYTNKCYLKCEYYDNGYKYYIEEIKDKKGVRLSVDPTTIVFNNLFIYQDYISNKYTIKDINNNVLYNISSGGSIRFYSDGYFTFRESIVFDLNGNKVFE